MLSFEKNLSYFSNVFALNSVYVCMWCVCGCVCGGCVCGVCVCVRVCVCVCIVSILVAKLESDSYH